MPRVQLALRVADLEQSVQFYSKLFGAEPAKRRPGYANFAIAEPPLKLVLIEGQPGEQTRLDHLGVEVESPEDVAAASARLSEAGLATVEETGASCCYALQDKVWVHGPGREPWEVYVVTGDAENLAQMPPGLQAERAASECCVAGSSEKPARNSVPPRSAPRPSHL